MQEVEIILTGDGSHSLLNTALNETYHSRHGARQESLHVFIRNGLDYFVEKYKPGHVFILEVGFGTGLNALLSLERSDAMNATVSYTTVEPYPVNEQIWSRLNYAERDRQRSYFEQLHESSWGVDHALNSKFVFRKERSKIQDLELSLRQFDLVFFDAFAPGKQPEMWSLDIMTKIESAMRPNGALVTYSATGELKRNLRSLGMQVESIPGAPGKKEMTRASKVPRVET
jgi:tRNA U34 5-methylaminomethyl-2-thiouridine-forming methyltransferase MnmC